MVEIELKFQLAQAQKKRVLQRLKKAGARTIALQAKYYDTSDHVLANHGIAIRLRQEGEHWVQTFKATDNSNSKSSHLQRIEEEIHLGHCEHEPELDLTLYKDNKTVQRLLDKVLQTSNAPLQLQFQTRVQRLYMVEHSENSAVEICLDEGEIIAGQSSTPICEMEFELKQGTVEHVIQSAKNWVAQYGLWLDVRSKAERGNLLATSQTVSPAARAKPLHLTADLTAEQVLQHIVANCLQHLLPNSAAIAAGVANPEHIHQARIAIRRLRSALKHFADWSTHVNPDWQTQLTALFRQLGTTRDADVITTEVIPQLVDIGAPDLGVSLAAEQASDLTQSFAQTDTVNLLLDLLTYAYTDFAAASHLSNKKTAKKHGVKHRIAKSLDRLHHKIIDHANQFSELDIEERHDTRKRVKQLRYLIEFVASLYPKKQVKHYLNHLQPVQDHLGAYNDMIVAEEFFEQQLEHNPHFWFALGWSKAQQQYLLNDAERALKIFAPTKTFW